LGQGSDGSLNVAALVRTLSSAAIDNIRAIDQSLAPVAPPSGASAENISSNSLPGEPTAADLRESTTASLEGPVASSISASDAAVSDVATTPASTPASGDVISNTHAIPVAIHQAEEMEPRKTAEAEAEADGEGSEMEEAEEDWKEALRLGYAELASALSAAGGEEAVSESETELEVCAAATAGPSDAL